MHISIAANLQYCFEAEFWSTQLLSIFHGKVLGELWRVICAQVFISTFAFIFAVVWTSPYSLVCRFDW